MRKLILALTLLTFTLGGGVAFAVDLPSDIGEIKRSTGASQATATRVYKLVRFASENLNTIGISAGEAVVYDTVSDDGVTIRRTTTSGDGAFAGIAVTTIATSDSSTGTTAADDSGRRNWGYIIVHGPTTAYVMAGGTNGHSVGDPFITSTDTGAIAALERALISSDGANVNSSTSINANITRQLKAASNRGGFFYDAADTSAVTADVFVNVE